MCELKNEATYSIVCRHACFTSHMKSSLETKCLNTLEVLIEISKFRMFSSFNNSLCVLYDHERSNNVRRTIQNLCDTLG